MQPRVRFIIMFYIMLCTKINFILSLSYLYLVSMVMYFWLNLLKCPKMGSNGQSFANLIAKKTVLNHVKHIIMIK